MERQRPVHLSSAPPLLSRRRPRLLPSPSNFANTDPKGPCCTGSNHLRDLVESSTEVDGFMRRLLRQIMLWVMGTPPPTTDPAHLEPIYQRRFRGHDRERFIQIWREVARISHTDPSELHEDDELKELGVGKVRFPDLVLEELCEYASSYVGDIPEGQITTLGEYVDWLLGDQRRATPPVGAR